MKTKLKSLFAVALCAVGLTASALPPSPYRDIWSSTPDPQAIKDPTDVIDWGMSSRTFESFDAKHGKFLEASADEMIAAYTARIAKDPTDCEALISRAFAYLKKAGENEAFDRIAQEFGFTFNNDTMHFTGELIQKKGETPEMNDVSAEVCDILLPLMKKAYADLSAVPDRWKGDVAITPDIYPVDEAVYFDWADVLCAKMGLAETMCVLNMVKGFDVTMDSDLLEYTFNSRSPKNGKRGVQPILENNPDFFSKVRDQKAATEAGDWWASAATLLDQWDKAHAKRSDGKQHFFDWNFEHADHKAVTSITWLRTHRDGLINLPYWASPFDYTLMNGDSVQFWTLQPLFAGKFLREHFPEFGVGVKEPWCNEPLLDTLPDSTLCGIYPGVSRTYIGNLMTNVARAGDFTTLPPYTPDSASSVHAIWYTNMFELGFANTGNPAMFAWESQSPLVLLDPEFNVRGVTAVFTGWSFSGYPNGSKSTWEGSEIPTPYTKESPMYKRRNVVATANFTIPKVTYLDFDGTSGKMVERTDECELVNANTTEFTTGKVYAVAGDITIAKRITVWSTPENPAKLVLCDGATLWATNGVEVDVRSTATNALVICGQALGTGTLESTGYYNHAGIGGGSQGSGSTAGKGSSCGIVTINGGTVIAKGGYDAAGIGGGAQLFNPGVGGTVTINGGTVIATGGEYGAGIGGGHLADGGTVTINGGTVTATGGASSGSGSFFGSGIGAGYSGKNHGTVKFGAGIASGVEAGELERLYVVAVKPFYMTTAEYVADHHLQYVTLPCYSLKIPEAEGYSYAVSYEGAQPNAVLADQTNTYAIAAGATARVRFTLGEDYVWTKEPEENPMIIANLSGDTVIDLADLPTTRFEKKGSEGNPWAVGYSTRDSVAAWTNGTDKLVVEGAGNMKDFTEGDPAPWGTGIAEVEIGADVTSIGARAFADSQLGSVTIPASVTSIGTAAFFGSTSLSNVTVEAMTPPALGEGAFVELAEGYKICVPAGTGAAYKAAPDWSLYADSIVEGRPGSPTNPWAVGTPNADDVTAYTNGVGGLVVEGDGNMRDFDPSRDPAPWGTDITSVKIGEDVTDIGAKAFCDCTSLSNVTVKAMTPPVLGDHALTNLAENLTIYVPFGTSEAYKAAPGWSDFAEDIVELPEPIAAESDEFAVDLRPRIEFEKGKTRIDVVTWSATAWGAVPASMSTDIGWMNLDTQANGTLASDLTGEDAADFDLPAKDGEYVLTHSTGNFLSFATFVVSGTGNPVGSMANPWSIGSGEGDTVVAYVTDDGELVIAGSGAMGNQCVENPPWTKGSVTSLTIGRNVTSIPDYAFFGYTELSNVTFATGAQLGSIGSHAFAACSSMEELEIPANVTNCGPAVVVGTPNVTVSEDNKTFAVVGGALCDVKSNKVISGLDAAVVTIPEGMVEIGECAFSTNGALTSVTIPASVTNIAAEAFKGCANLTNVFVRATEPPTLVRYAFKDCNAGLKIYVPEGKAEAYKNAEGWSEYASKINEMTGEGTAVNPWKVGTGVNAYIENGTLVIEGQGAMEDFTADHPAPWMDAASDIKSVEIGKGVTKVGNCAFIDCSITAPGTFTVDDEEFELNLLAFVSADKTVTNAPATGVFRVVKAESGKAESVVAFGPKDSTAFSFSIERSLRHADWTTVQLLTLNAAKEREYGYLESLAGDTPYSKSMQKLLDDAKAALANATTYNEIARVEATYKSQIEAQTEKDKTHEIEGTDITWRVMDGALVIEGEGEMPDFVAPDFPEGAPWDEYKGDISNATVTAGIESLGAAAFAKYPAGKDKAVFFENPAQRIKLAAFVSNDGTATNDFTAAQILLPNADGGVTNAVKFLADTDPDAPRYDSIAEAIEQDWVTEVTAYSLDGLKELAETWLSADAGPQPWTERVAAAVTNAVIAIEEAADADSVRQAGIDGRSAIQTAQGDDEKDAKLGGTIPGSDLSWKLVGGQLVISGRGAMPEELTPVPWSESIGDIGTVVVGVGVTGLSKGLFTSDLTAPADTVIFGSKETSVPLAAFVDAGGTVNDAVAVLFATETDGVNEAPCGWTDADDKTKTYGSYAEALADGATAVKPVFATSEEKVVEEQIEKAPAAIVEKIQPVDESGKFIKDPNGDLIDVATVVENVNTNGAETSERIVATEVRGLDKTAQAEASESGCSTLKLTIDAIPPDPSDLAQEWMTREMPYGEDFAARFADITLKADDEPIIVANAVIEIHIPYVTKDRKDFSVTRMHDGRVEMFTEVFDIADKADGTFMVNDGEIVVWTDKFSAYAVGSTAVPRCTVNYDGNGAEGTMASDKFLTGIPTNLTANAFTAAGYAFQGWTTNGAGGRIVFADRAAIADPQPGVIYDLKAVWTPVPTTVGSYDDLKKVLEQAAKIGKPVEIVLDGTITPPAGEALVIPATVDVKFSGDGKIGGLVFREGVSLFTDSVAEHSDVFAYVDEALTNVAGLVICNGLPEESRPIDLDALTDAMEKAMYLPAVTPLNALVATGDGTVAMPGKWVDAKGNTYDTLQAAIDASVAAVTPDFGSEEKPVPPRVIVEEVEVAPGVTVTATMKNDGSGVSGAVQALGAEGLADFAEARTTSVELDVTAKSSVPTASQLLNAAEKALNGRSTTSTTPHYVDISLWTVAADGAKTAVHELDETLAILIPWTFEPNHAYKVVRCHNGTEKAFTETPDADGEYAEFDEANGLITVHSKFFSDFAVVDFALATVRITVPAAKSLPEGVKSITVKADGAAVQPTTTSGGMSTYEIAVGTPVEVDFEAKSGYAFPETGKGTWTWTPEGGIPAGDKTFSAEEIKPEKVRDPMPACVYRFRAHVYTTKGVAQNLRTSGSACAPGESSCVVMRGRDKTVIEGWLYQCECVCDGLGESAVIWDAYRKVPLSDAAFETQFLNVIGSRSTDAEWAWTFTGTAVYDSLREQDYELVGSGYGAFNPSAGICTSFSGAFAGTASASYDLVTKRTAATADCVCQPSQVLKCDAVDGVSFELERTAAFGQWKVKYDATASKAYQKGGRLTIPNFIR